MQCLEHSNVHQIANFYYYANLTEYFLYQGKKIQRFQRFSVESRVTVINVQKGLMERGSPSIKIRPFQTERNSQHHLVSPRYLTVYQIFPVFCSTSFLLFLQVRRDRTGAQLEVYQAELNPLEWRLSQSEIRERKYWIAKMG